MGFDHESEKIFFVRCPVDLNEIPKQLLVSLKYSKNLFCDVSLELETNFDYLVAFIFDL